MNSPIRATKAVEMSRAVLFTFSSDHLASGSMFPPFPEELPPLDFQRDFVTRATLATLMDDERPVRDNFPLTVNQLYQNVFQSDNHDMMINATRTRKRPTTIKTI